MQIFEFCLSIYISEKNYSIRFNFLKRVTFPSREERLKKVKSEIAQASKKKKGFMTPERKKKLRVSSDHPWADS